jgi:hypothetical protein
MAMGFPQHRHGLVHGTKLPQGVAHQIGRRWRNAADRNRSRQFLKRWAVPSQQGLPKPIAPVIRVRLPGNLEELFPECIVLAPSTLAHGRPLIQCLDQHLADARAADARCRFRSLHSFQVDA